MSLQIIRLLLSIVTFCIMATSYCIGDNFIAIYTCPILFFLLFFSFFDKVYFSPIFLFFISIFCFVLVRPVYEWVNHDWKKIVSIGLGVNGYNINVVVAFIMMQVSLITLSYVITLKQAQRLIYYIPLIKYHAKHLSKLLCISSVALGILFLYYSYGNMRLLISGGDYFSFLSSFDARYFTLFFLAKYLIVLSILFSKNKDISLLLTFLLFIYSIGFILVGLRGYTIAYLFLTLCFISLRYKIKTIYVVLIAILILFVASYALSARLSMSLYNNYIDMIFSPILQQGASFEAVFGSVIFRGDLIKCIDYFQYFSNSLDFGECIDKVRGLGNMQGSFASSYFAEVSYLGLFIGIITNLLFGLALAIVQSIYEVVRFNFNAGRMSNKAYLIILFLTIPNLIYFARSSAFDFIIKVLSLFFIVYIFSMFNYFVNMRPKT
ncbi:O-antigen polysaccharide polymerase Wzy [Edwardsiella tarda]|uniref:O-antigen polysaccharide polymerase Wzy n=1 Tax=Edwardsiella tarda TaxID=636 RepID=UPI002444A468|nr:O-antigen polysaccharide polymerase Wzy [Edwardsiella tarda]WGE30132.1 O-antigen polysaccharide polymerase Wzy [Edwardsiella tarda]